MLKHFPAYCIKYNINNIETLQSQLGIPINIFNSKIEEILNPKNQVYNDLLYDTCMHIELLKKISRSREKGVLIFDSTKLTRGKQALVNFVKNVKEFTDENKERNWHILLLGSETYVKSSHLTHNIKRVNKFWGASGFYIKSEIIPVIIDTFEKYNSKGFFLPINWLYEKVMQERNLIVYGPSEPDMFLKAKN